MLYIPENYTNLLGSYERTEQAIKVVKDLFQSALAENLGLLRVTAPMVVLSGSGLNDELSGKERPVEFGIRDLPGERAEIVHSLAKWKRWKLAEMGMEAGRGIYTDMNALRPEEELDNIHSIYVDQWDWEKVMTPSERTEAYLRTIVEGVYRSLLHTEERLAEAFPELRPTLPKKITFIHSQELLDRWPDLTAKERENRITKECGAVFVIGIGGPLSNGTPHDSRAADYDDWSTPSESGLVGLNGDILLWNEVLGQAFEISSMGIRVNREALLRQITMRGEERKLTLPFHKALLDGRLPQTVGGGIGQSRLCMFLLRKAHIGEIQSSIWPEEMRKACAAKGIVLA